VLEDKERGSNMQKKILIVDDEEDILTSVKMFLDSLGYSAKTVNNGKDAIDLIKKEKFDLILLDMLMPEMSGKEVLERIRDDKKIAKQKVAFLTVVSLSQVGKAIINKLKPVAFIEKPVDTVKLKQILQKILS
jgi:CheY-like chemotaxis protein